MFTLSISSLYNNDVHKYRSELRISEIEHIYETNYISMYIYLFLLEHVNEALSLTYHKAEPPFPNVVKLTNSPTCLFV